MGKHDKTIVEGTTEFYEAKIQRLVNENKELKDKLAFAAENNAKLIKENAKWQKWMHQNDANAQEIIDVKDDEISMYRDTIVELAVRAVGKGNV